MSGGARAVLERELRAAGAAHHAAFAHVGGADPDWAAWYAHWLGPRVAGVLSLDEPALAAALAAAEAERAHRAPGADWARFYAEVLLPGD